MRKNRDEFAGLNKTSGKGKAVIVAAAVLAICIAGIMCARKLMMDQKYITLEHSKEQVMDLQNG